MDAYLGALRDAFPAAEIEFDGAGGKFSVRIISEAFEGKNTVARHRAVYAVLNSSIASGEIHALTITALTPSEA